METKRQLNKWKPIFITGGPGVGKTNYALRLAKNYQKEEYKRFLALDLVHALRERIAVTDTLKVIIIDQVPNAELADEIYKQIILRRLIQDKPYPEMMVFISNSINERLLKEAGLRQLFHLVQTGSQYRNSNGRN